MKWRVCCVSSAWGHRCDHYCLDLPAHLPHGHAFSHSAIGCFCRANLAGQPLPGELPVGLEAGTSLPGPLLAATAQQPVGGFRYLCAGSGHRHHRLLCPQPVAPPLGPGDEQHGPLHLPDPRGVPGHSSLSGYGGVWNPE